MESKEYLIKLLKNICTLVTIGIITTLVTIILFGEQTFPLVINAIIIMGIGEFLVGGLNENK